MKTRWAHGVLLLLVFYLPLEEFLLKWLPVSDGVYTAARQLPDLVVIGLALTVVLGRLAKVGTVRVVGRGFELALLTLLACALFNAFLNDAAPVTVGLQLKALLRYVFVAYILLNLEIDERDLKVFAFWVLLAVGIQMVVGAAEYLAGEPVRSFFLPRTVEIMGVDGRFAFTSFRESERGYVFGTSGHTIGFGMFMVVGLAVWVCRFSEKTFRYWAGAVAILALTLASGSRASALAGVLVVLLHQARKGKAVVLGFVLIGCVAIPLAVERAVPGALAAAQLAIGDYRYLALSQRLGILVYVLPAFLSADGTTLMMGLTADRGALARFTDGISQAPIIMVEDVGTIEDVYWVALLVYYGAVGLVAFLGVLAIASSRLLNVLKAAKATEHRIVVGAALLLLAVVPLLNLFNQAFEVRLFSFYLWLFIGLGLAAARRPRVCGDPEHPAVDLA